MGSAFGEELRTEYTRPVRALSESRKNAGRSAFNLTKGQVFSFKPHNYVAPAGVRSSPATCRAAFVALHSKGFAAGGPQLPGSREALEHPEPQPPDLGLRPRTQSGLIAQARRGSSLTLKGRPAGPGNFSPGTGPGNRSQGRPGGTGWSQDPQQRVNQRRPTPRSPSQPTLDLGRRSGGP